MQNTMFNMSTTPEARIVLVIFCSTTAEVSKLGCWDHFYTRNGKGVQMAEVLKVTFGY